MLVANYPYSSAPMGGEKRKKIPSNQTTIRMDPILRELVDEECVASNIPRAQFMRNWAYIGAIYARIARDKSASEAFEDLDAVFKTGQGVQLKKLVDAYKEMESGQKRERRRSRSPNSANNSKLGS